MKYELYGIREELEYGGYDNPSKRYDVEDLLTTFDSEKLAKKYVEASLLKAAKNQYFYPDIRRGKYRFKKESLLRYYNHYEIRLREVDPEVPNNPKI